MNTEDRIQRLEARNRRLTVALIFVAGVAAAAVALVLVAPAIGGPQNLGWVSTTKIELVSGSGTVLARLGPDASGSGRLDVFNASGVPIGQIGGGGSGGQPVMAPTGQPTRSSPGQCQAITKKGLQCSRAAQAGSSYCWQHAKGR